MPRPMGRPQNKVKYPGKLLMRLINYIFRDYKVHCIAVFILIFVGVIANVQGTMFTRDLIDKYITPFLLSDGTPNFSPLAHAIERVAVFYGIGIVATYAYNRIMINVSQGTLRNLRNAAFANPAFLNTSIISCLNIWKSCRSNILIPMHMVISCQFTRTISIPCGRWSARVFRRSSTADLRSSVYLSVC